MGRKLPLASWGWRGQIADLARMPEIVHAELPWLRVDRRRIYAVGGSMGGHETLLLLGQYPKLLAGAVAFDSVTNFYPPLLRLCPQPRRTPCPGTGARGSRGHAPDQSTRIRPPQSDALALGGRPLGCAAAALVERRGQDRD
jgi:pimeloyl-ACP methyl ester carboxylesterase